MVSILLAGCIWLAGCARPTDHGTPAKATVSSPLEADCAIFDRLVTAEALFPDPAQRELYRMLPPVTENGQRTYTFRLKSQPGLDEKRHFDLITVTWAPGGKLGKSKGAGISGAGGPGGGFLDAFAQTFDGKYDVRVSRGMLLSAACQVPDFDVAKAAATMASLYQRSR